MSFLLDTNVLSEVRKGPRAHPNVRAWFDPVPEEELFISVLVLGEIRKGIETLRPRDPTAAASYERWLNTTKLSFSNRILPITETIADQFGRIASIRPLAVIDGLMAATALSHSLTLVTRNSADIKHTGATILNPF